MSVVDRSATVLEPAMSIDPGIFHYVQKLVQEETAVVLGADKDYLVESRLQTLAQQEGFESGWELIKHLRFQPRNQLREKVIEAMMTTESSFFRDNHPFEALRTVVLPDLIRRREKEQTLNIWCAACASGQEPYSVCMLLREHFPKLAQWTVHMMAGDISHKMLERARQGQYNQVEINRGLPVRLMMKYFTKQGLDSQIHEDIRRMVEFRRMNLAGPWPPMPDLDIIFLRNVLIYFDEDTRKMILGKVKRILRHDGYLFLGTSETMMGLDDDFQEVVIGKARCYQLQRAGKA